MREVPDRGRPVTKRMSVVIIVLSVDNMLELSRYYDARGKLFIIPSLLPIDIDELQNNDRTTYARGKVFVVLPFLLDRC